MKQFLFLFLSILIQAVTAPSSMAICSPGSGRLGEEKQIFLKVNGSESGFQEFLDKKERSKEHFFKNWEVDLASEWLEKYRDYVDQDIRDWVITFISTTRIREPRYTQFKEAFDAIISSKEGLDKYYPCNHQELVSRVELRRALRAAADLAISQLKCEQAATHLRNAENILVKYPVTHLRSPEERVQNYIANSPRPPDVTTSIRSAVLSANECNKR